MGSALEPAASSAISPQYWRSPTPPPATEFRQPRGGRETAEGCASLDSPDVGCERSYCTNKWNTTPSGQQVSCRKISSAKKRTQISRLQDNKMLK